MPSMSQIYNFDSTWVIIIAILLLLGFAFLFMREKTGYTLLGLLRLIASLVYSPLVYFKKLFVRLTEFGIKGDKEYASSKQYLLNKFLVITEGLLIIAGVLIISAGLVNTWNSFIPPEYLREQIKNVTEQIQTSEVQFQVSKQKFDALEAGWQNQKTTLINNYKAERENKKNAAIKENKSIETKYAGDQQFNQILSYYTQNSSPYNKNNAEYYKSNVQNWVNNLPADENKKTTLNKYAENWYIIKVADMELGGFSEESLRQEIQPDYQSLKYQVDDYTRSKARMEQVLTELNIEARYNFKALFIGLLATFIMFVFYLWLIGLFLEFIFLALDLATNVRKVKEKLVDTAVDIPVPQIEIKAEPEAPESNA